MLVHSDGGSYKPLNWMSPPCWLIEEPGRWMVQNKAGEQLVITIDEVLHDSRHELGVDPGLVKDGVEAHLQALLAEHVATLGERLVAGAPGVPDADRSGRPDVPGRDGRRTSRWRSSAAARSTASEQLTRYLTCSTATRCWRRSSGVFAAQQIKPQARTLAEDRGIRCVRPGLRRRCKGRTTPAPAAVLSGRTGACSGVPSALFAVGAPAVRRVRRRALH